jgi:hypothetical protein
MEIERLPLGQSLADKHRAATLKWRGKPPGIPPEMAVEFMAKLKAGSTIRKLTNGGKDCGPAIVSYDRFKKHCEFHPEWAAEALRVSKINSSIGKGAFNRNRTHCINGHLLSEHGRVAIGPNASGRSRHGAPDRNTQKMPLRTRRSFYPRNATRLVGGLMATHS